MPRGYRWLSAADEEEIWARLRAGHAVKPTARALGLSTGGVRAYLVRCGGIRPVPRRRSPGRLSLARAGGDLPRSGRRTCRCARSRRVWVVRRRRLVVRSRLVAAMIGTVPHRRISRRGRGQGVPRRASWQPIAGWVRCVAEKLKREQWSPEQIAGWLKATYPDDPEMQVSHETIYRALFIQSRGALRRELTAHLRTGRVIRRPGRDPAPGWSWWPARDPRTSPNDRAEADDRAVPGHWEGDLVFGKRMSPVATLVERSTRFVMLSGATRRPPSRACRRCAGARSPPCPQH